MSERSGINERIQHLIVNIPENTEVFHLYGLAAAGGLAIIELFFSEEVSKYIKAVVLTSLFLVIILRILRKSDAVPDVSDSKISKTYNISVPCSNKDLDGAISIAEFYFKNHTINSSVVRRNRELNKYCSVVASDDRGQVQGFLDLFCFEENSLEHLIKGVKTEPDLTSVDVVKYQPGRGLYIGGFAVAASASKIEKEKLYYSLVYGMLMTMKKELLKENNEINIYAIGYTKAGIKAIQRMDIFLPVDNSRLGRDTPPFRGVITRKEIEEKLKQFRVARAFCRLKFAE